MTIPRGIEGQCRRVLWDYRKMAFVSGPRQVGKTTFAKEFLRSAGQGSYFNWDDLNDQKMLSREPYFFESYDRDPGKPFLVVVDEIHKYRRWKSYLKGAFDRSAGEFSFMVTGSGRLDLYSRGGDSLIGRYFGLPLFPLTTGELARGEVGFEDFLEALSDPPDITPEARQAYSALFELNGFPEPFLRGEKDFLSAWSAQRTKLLVREDIRDATAIRQLSMIEMLMHLLPERVGNPLSISLLREDLGVAFETVRDWLAVLHQFYYSFAVVPFSKSLPRALQKAPKVYLFDWSELTEPSSRFENLVALHLHKAVALWNAEGQARAELRYLRDREKREVDFVIAERGTPRLLIECKLTDTSVSASLLHYQQKLRVPTVVQLVGVPGVCRKMKTDAGTAWVISADRWLALLP